MAQSSIDQKQEMESSPESEQFCVPVQPESANFRGTTAPLQTAGARQPSQNMLQTLARVSKIIQNSSACKAWRQVGRDLGISDANLDAIEIDFPNDLKERCHQMLRMSFDQNGGSCATTCNTLINVLDESGYRAVAETIRADPEIYPQDGY